MEWHFLFHKSIYHLSKAKIIKPTSNPTNQIEISRKQINNNHRSTTCSIIYKCASSANTLSDIGDVNRWQLLYPEFWWPATYGLTTTVVSPALPPVPLGFGNESPLRTSSNASSLRVCNAPHIVCSSSVTWKRIYNVK